MPPGSFPLVAALATGWGISPTPWDVLEINPREGYTQAENLDSVDFMPTSPRAGIDGACRGESEAGLVAVELHGRINTPPQFSDWRRGGVWTAITARAICSMLFRNKGLRFLLCFVFYFVDVANRQPCHLFRGYMRGMPIIRRLLPSVLALKRGSSNMAKRVLAGRDPSSDPPSYSFRDDGDRAPHRCCRATGSRHD